MHWCQWIALSALAVTAGSCFMHFMRLIRLGKPRDYSAPSGSESAGVAYSFTVGMSPAKKESAYLHLPTYTAGLAYHLGTFLSILLLVLSFFNLISKSLLFKILAILLVISSLCGIFILIKRISVRKLRNLSNPDDYLSNILVTAFQGVTSAFMLIGESATCLYYLTAAALFFYLPVGKLKHLVYFFAARYQLGIFFGRRGVWPGRE
jgi:hypothetical protein